MPLGYKVMVLDGDELVSIANDNFRFPARVDLDIRMPHPGIFLGSDEQFVLDYYTGLTDEQEVLVTFKYSKQNVTRDRGDELAVTRARIKRMRRL